MNVSSNHVSTAAEQLKLLFVALKACFWPSMMWSLLLGSLDNPSVLSPAESSLVSVVKEAEFSLRSLLYLIFYVHDVYNSSVSKHWVKAHLCHVWKRNGLKPRTSLWSCSSFWLLPSHPSGSSVVLPETDCNITIKPPWVSSCSRVYGSLAWHVFQLMLHCLDS